MQLTRQADYAIRAMLRLATAESGTVVQTREIAIQENIPEKYLPTIMRTLARAGLVRTLRGNRGGVLLARRPDQINLREVIEAIEEPIVINRCLHDSDECTRGGFCPVMPVWHQIQKTMIDRLESTTFADLAASEKKSSSCSAGSGWQLSETETRIPA